jgi:hypothetical protein
MIALSMIIMDTDETQDAYYKAHFGQFFEELGYIIDSDHSFLIRRDINDVLADLGGSRHSTCFIFICDLSLSKGGVPTNLGVSFVRRVIQKYPELFCILASYGDE